LFWWSGGDIAKDKLRYQLDELVGKGIGGTIVGYSHLPDGRLDHGDPAPFSEDWWELFTWFVDESAKRGLSVGVQDYGIIGPVLLSIAPRTAGLHAGSLFNITQSVAGADDWSYSIDDSELMSVAAWAVDEPSGDIEAPTLPEIVGSVLRWTVPEGNWTVSIVLKRRGHIGLSDTEFDPLHPDSGQAVIEAFYDPFAARLGDEFGRTFTTFFQDELDLGLTTPMWNDGVADTLAKSGFASRRWLHALWHDRGPETRRFRALYRDTVVALLERHYFEPVFQWNDVRGCQLVMDQLSRGDLKLGHQHYSDFMQTMKWYHGPGNDDPDLTAERGAGAFRISASIAHLHDRPLVVNEAFHSSGWGIMPRDIICGVNIGFVSGANHLIPHALYYTTEGGWWEWAAPDFHYRQPWWLHSDALWLYVARASELLRVGRAVCEIAIVDPTQDLDLTGDAVGSPELAQRLLLELGSIGANADLVPMAYFAAGTVEECILRIENGRYRAVIVPGILTLRDGAIGALNTFIAAGGIVVVVDPGATSSETRTLTKDDLRPTARFSHDADVKDIAVALAGLIEQDIHFDCAGIAAVHRDAAGVDVFFLVNVSAEHITTSCTIRLVGRAEVWDLFEGTSAPLDAVRLANGRTRWNVSLSPGESMTVVLAPGGNREIPALISAERRAQKCLPLNGPWIAAVKPTLDNRFGDFEVGGAALGIETWRLKTAPTIDGPWADGIVRDGIRFSVIGPVAPEEAASVAERIATLAWIDPETPVEVDGVEFRWRPYRFSLETGIDNDPLLRDRMTGPHGLKRVPPEFLDPAALDRDPPAGSTYFFWSAVDSEEGSEVLTVSSRAKVKGWVGGREVQMDHPERPAHHFEPWGLLDLASVSDRHEVTLADGHTSLLVALTVAVDQPTRAAVVLGGKPDSRLKARLEWWNGEEPARRFQLRHADTPPSTTRTFWVRTTVPPGSSGVAITTDGVIDGAQVNGMPRDIRLGDDPGTIVITLPQPLDASTRELIFRVTPSRASSADLSALLEPLRWIPGTGPIVLADWSELGLADFSGIVRYSTTCEVDSVDATITLKLEGLSGTAVVWVNGVRAPTTMITSSRADLTGLLHAGVNELDIEVANSLVNFYSRVPSPYSAMQRPGGGFTAAMLVIDSV
jgi:hypothetical protein